MADERTVMVTGHEQMWMFHNDGHGWRAVERSDLGHGTLAPTRGAERDAMLDDLHMAHGLLRQLLTDYGDTPGDRVERLDLWSDTQAWEWVHKHFRGVVPPPPSDEEE